MGSSMNEEFLWSLWEKFWSLLEKTVSVIDSNLTEMTCAFLAEKHNCGLEEVALLSVERRINGMISRAKYVVGDKVVRVNYVEMMVEEVGRITNSIPEVPTLPEPERKELSDPE